MGMMMHKWNFISVRFTDVPLDQREEFLAAKRKAIPSYDQLARPEAEQVLTLLAEHFKTKLPQLKWNRRCLRGKYNHRKNTIATGPNAWRGVTNSLLHEFSHCLAMNRHGDKVNHGPEFMAVLWEVIQEWHGKQADYAWKEEYARIAKWAEKRGAFIKAEKDSSDALPLAAESSQTAPMQ